MTNPDPQTLEGEELNLAVGKKAGPILKLRFVEQDGKLWRIFPNGGREHFDPVHNAQQCLGLTPKCNIHWVGEICGAIIKSRDGLDGAYGEGPTELIARCRAYLAAE